MKMQLYIIPLLLLAVICRADDAVNNSTLQLVQVLYRHGARTPIDLYPTDPNAGKFWLGMGQLTNEGKNNQLELGRFLRQRYSSFLHARYHMNYTLVRASDADRTLMSAQANLAGLYPPQGQDVWNAQLAWQPIPVHTRPYENDYVFRFGDACARYRTAHADELETTRVRAIDKHYAQLYAHLAKHTGANLTRMGDVGRLYDTLSIEDHLNMTVPAWARARLPAFNNTPAYPDLMRPLQNLAFQLMGGTPELRRLSGGPLLQLMVARMAAAVNGTLEPPSRQLFVYSGHDTNVATLLAALGAFNDVAPPLASCVMLELHRDHAGGFFVKLLYRNETTHAPYELRLPNCTQKCPWEAFRDMTAPARPQHIEEECKEAGGAASWTVLGEAAALGLLMIIFLLVGIWLCCGRRRSARDQFRYSAVDRAFDTE